MPTDNSPFSWDRLLRGYSWCSRRPRGRVLVSTSGQFGIRKLVPVAVGVTGVDCQVSDAVPESLFHVRTSEETLIDHPHRIALWPPLAPRSERRPACSSSSQADHQRTCSLMPFNLLVDLAELYVPAPGGARPPGSEHWNAS